MWCAVDMYRTMHDLTQHGVDINLDLHHQQTTAWHQCRH